VRFDASSRDLTVCLRCGAAFVVPVRWSELDAGWAMVLRCGECGDRRRVHLSDAEAERYGRALDLAVAELELLADAMREGGSAV
jgi:DNA-directed RNA polymerase subunit RPC12/RpoP